MTNRQPYVPMGEGTQPYVPLSPVPRDPGCSHPARQRLSRNGDVITERCRLCDVVLVTDRSTSTTRTEVTGR